MTVGYDNGYLRAQYLGFFYLLGLCWFVLTAAMLGAAAFIHRLGKLSQQSQLEIVNSALAERQKISADMHDSIGSSLAALLAYFTTENFNVADVKRRVGEILMELRFLVDSAETDDGDINLLLSNVRHRMGSGIELAGIALQWPVADLPQIAGLAARDALAIKLILMEALSNVLHHSRAGTATADGKLRPQTLAPIAVAVADDGIGFDPADAGVGTRACQYAKSRRQHLDRRDACHRLRAGKRHDGAARSESAAGSVDTPARFSAHSRGSGNPGSLRDRDDVTGSPLSRG